MKCPNCGNDVEPGKRFCRVCGADCGYAAAPGNNGAVRAKSCPSCGKLIDGGERFCKGCGNPLNAKSTEPTKKSNTAVIVLSIILAFAVLLFGLIIALLLRQDKPEDTYSHDEEAVTRQAYGEDYDDEAYEESYEYPPHFDSVYATSTLPTQNSTYYPSNAVDGDADTTWTEGVEGFGYGEKLIFSADEKQKVSRIRILNGFCKSEALYYQNNRLKGVRIVFSDGTELERYLDDAYLELYTVELTEPIICDEFYIEIISVYEGTHYDDTCISEVIVE